MTNRTAEEIQSDIENLKKEIQSIRDILDSLVSQRIMMDRQEIELKKRLEEINGSMYLRYSNIGLIKKLEIELKESKFPIFKDNLRIVAITDKTISLKKNGVGFDCVTKYNKETGYISRAKSSYGAIDVQKALEIWSNHNAK